MNNQSIFQLIAHLIQKEKVSCLLIGGFAINYYKVARQTADIDFLITKEDFEKIFPSLKKAGYKQEPSQENFVQLTSSKFSLMDVDFMFVERQTLNKILKEAKIVEIARQKFKVPSLNHLIALKLHSIKYNPKLRMVTDFPDIINLIRINKVNVNDMQFKELCLKFGTEEIYQRIKEVLK